MRPEATTRRDAVRIRTVVGIVLVAAVSACGGGADPAASGEVRVSAAASLTDAFTEIEEAFEATVDGADVGLNFGGSSALREQIIEGAPVDVFASANLRNMEEVGDRGLIQGEPRIFAVNMLQIAVPPGNPGGVTGLADLARDELLVGLCAEGTPCGDFGRELLAGVGVTAAVDTNEPDVRALLTKIEQGELDAGIVYVTDIIAADGGVEGVSIPGTETVVAEYPIAVLADAGNRSGAEAFAEFVLSAEGRRILGEYGFATP